MNYKLDLHEKNLANAASKLDDIYSPEIRRITAEIFNEDFLKAISPTYELEQAAKDALKSVYPSLKSTEALKKALGETSKALTLNHELEQAAKKALLSHGGVAQMMIKTLGAVSPISYLGMQINPYVGSIAGQMLRVEKVLGEQNKLYREIQEPPTPKKPIKKALDENKQNLISAVMSENGKKSGEAKRAKIQVRRERLWKRALELKAIHKDASFAKLADLIVNNPEANREELSGRTIYEDLLAMNKEFGQKI